HQIDRPTRFSEIDYQALGEHHPIEVAEVDPLPRDNPPTQAQEKEPYLADRALSQAVDLAIALGRPLLLQGDPGCGKTRLAYAVAYALVLPLEECYVKSNTRAQDLLYTYDAVRRLYDAQLGDNGPKDERTKEPLCRTPGNYVRLGPL